MKIVNLTPHAVTLRSPQGEDTTIPPSGTVARTKVIPGAVFNVEGIPVPVAYPDCQGGVEGIPDPEKGVVYIVSALVGIAIQRPDVFTLGTGPKDGAIRNEKGHIVAVTLLKSTKGTP